MGPMIHKLAIWLLIFIIALFEVQSSADNHLSSILKIRDDYMTTASKFGLELSFVPEIKEWTRPSFISWRAEAKAVAIPRWEELSKDQKALVVEMAGSSDRAELFFSLLFRWFLIPHELTHAYQDQRNIKLRPSISEKLANDMAAAFLFQNKSNLDQLTELENMMVDAETNLKKSSDDKLLDSFFDDYYQQFSNNNMRLYARYQVKFILNSLRRKKSLNVRKLFSQLDGKSIK
jgi:hypothetical protein